MAKRKDRFVVGFDNRQIYGDSPNIAVWPNTLGAAKNMAAQMGITFKVYELVPYTPKRKASKHK